MINLTQQGGELTIFGLSTDTKPTNVPAATFFLERDTGFQFTFTNSAWIPLIVPTLSVSKLTDQSATSSTTVKRGSSISVLRIIV